MNVTWSEEAIRALGVKTDVATAASIFGISRTRAYDRIKAGTFPVPVITVGTNHMVVPVAPILQALKISTDVPGETGLAVVAPDQLADMVAERVVSRLAAAMAPAARADPPPGPAAAPAARLRRVADSEGAGAA
jgi:hypothetical protein